MNNGMKATIIAYRGTRDIDVEFENGVIRKHVSSNCFANGKIGIADKKNRQIKNENKPKERKYKKHYTRTRKTPIKDSDYDKYRISCLGEVRTAKNGMKMTCIKYKNCRDIDVEFEDGRVIKHTTKKNFYTGVFEFITSENIVKKWLGQKQYMNGAKEYATIIAYRNSKDIDVEFDSGKIVKHCRLTNFVKGKIAKKKKKRRQ